MESFYLIVLSIAIILLILMLTYFGILIRRGKKNIVFPPTESICPDNWTMMSDGSCSYTFGTNTGLYTQSGLTGATVVPPYMKLSSNYYYLNPNNLLWSSSGETPVCSKKKWANNYSIFWDGVSNYNSC